MVVNDCGLKPAASAEANALGGAIFASAKMRPFALGRESGSCNRVRSSAASKPASAHPQSFGERNWQWGRQ